MDHFHRALDLAPNNADVRYLLAQTYMVAGQTDEAMKAYQEILRIAPEHLDARLQLAEIYRSRGNWNAAYKEYQHIIDLDAGSPQAASALEAIEKQQGSSPPEQTVAKNTPLRRNRPPHPSAPSLPGDIVRLQVPLAPQRLSMIPGITPPAALNSVRPEEKPDPRSVADLHKKLGVRYLNIREFRAAINEFLQALSLTPDDKDLYYFIGSSYHGLQQFAEAYDYYRRVDAGPYVGPAQSGTKQTEKAWREASKRREAQKFQTIKDETKSDTDTNNSNKSAKSLMTRILDNFKE
jgi:tetratricopeptide (TPR) repeat protein